MTNIEMANILAEYSKELSESEGLADKGNIQVKHAERILQMLDEARKDEAVEFGAWLCRLYSPIEVDYGVYRWWNKLIGGAYYTTQELYQLFKNR